MGALLGLLQLLPVGIDLISRGTGLIETKDAAKIRAGLELLVSGIALFRDINESGSRPGGPTPEDLQRVRTKYNISDDTLSNLLTGRQG